MNNIYILAIFVIAIAIMILMISKWNVHPAITLLLVVIALGLSIGLSGEQTMTLLTKGFGDTIGKVGLLFFLGCVLGKLLERTGAAIKITNFMYKVFGKKRAIWAIAVASAILGIPILADTIVIVLMPIISNLAIQTGASMAQYGTVLYLGAYVTASAVPPTPGPLAAAAFLNLDLSQAIIWGIIISIPGIFAGTLYCKYLKIDVLPKEEFLSKNVEVSKLSLFQSMAPIILPILLIMISSFFRNVDMNSTIKEFIMTLGNPIVAMLIAVAYSLTLTGTKWKSKEVLNDWVETGLRLSAMPIIVTGLGGSLALIIKDTKVAESIANSISQISIPPILIPFIIAALVNTITGSNTLGVLTGAAIIQPMLNNLDISPLAAYLACATGAQIFKHSNSSGFWVTVSLSNMDLAQGLKSVGGATAISGLVSGFIVVILEISNLI
ncbi:gluconate:H+ symporter, GntP family [Pasteurella testudinis DSM 23072]|uniref:Gluconate:H+ symporter, GntP family n=1 Tax=Pasteurella testudinis DSM 23072 TaxID=1122938 RepID=A0A1W1ULK4_9PAST|nr:SLC13 family permease [Pasteurella testudinis]SMB81691.1 gluconate:H+ symporter, GntP family [Pasteurella testudinis DSM 23072]SUB50337.1 gluconate permease [Pasteurella testudinis]